MGCGTPAGLRVGRASRVWAHTTPLLPGSATHAVLRHLLSHHGALRSSYRRHFEAEPILPGELQCFHLYHSASEIEGFVPAETLVAFGTNTDHGLRVRSI